MKIFNDMGLDNVIKKIDGLQRSVREEVPAIVAETATTYYKERFSRKEWDGKPWKPAVNPPGRGSLMVRSGNLMNSVRPAVVSPGKVVISAGSRKVPYARVHNEGFRGVVYIKPHHREGKKGRQQVKGYGKRLVMPRRQYMGMNKELTVKIINIIKGRMKEVLS